METYRIRVTKDYLTFSSAHFILYAGTRCERLHGHNYRVAAELEGPLDEDGLVFDFVELKSLLRTILAELDHRLLVPLESRKLTVDVQGERVRITYEDREWIIPRCDCALLPIESTTAELLARHVAGRVRAHLEERAAVPDGILRIEVEEAAGQSARYETSIRSGGEPRVSGGPKPGDAT